MMKKRTDGIIRMAFSAITTLTEDQIDAVALAIDATAAIAKYSGQEGTLQILADGLAFEFGDSQAKRIISRAPKFSDAVSGDDQSAPVASPMPYTAMSSKQRSRTGRLTPVQADAVNALTGQRAKPSNFTSSPVMR